VQFATEDEKWLAVDDELRDGAAFLEVRSGVCLREEIESPETDEKQKNRQDATRDSHVVGEDITANAELL